MIEMEFFETHFKKIRERWPRFYTDAMEQQVFGIVENTSSQSFVSFVSKALWSKDAPSLEEFLRYASNFSEQKTPTPKSNCQMCTGFGLVSAERFIASLGKSYVFSLRCDCEAGINQPRFYMNNGQQVEIRTWHQSRNAKLIGPTVILEKPNA